MDSLFAKAAENDLIIFAFSGHGDKGYFLPHDFIRSLPLSWLHHEDVKKSIKKSKAHHKLIIADACLSGSFKETKHKIPTVNQTSSGEDSSQIIVFLSSREKETSLENQDLKQGIFSYFLTMGLNGHADKNGDNNVTIAELFYYVRDNTYAFAKQKYNQVQCPVMYGKFDKNLIISKLKN